MKRDMDLIRDILLRVEASDEALPHPKTLMPPDCSHDKFAYHVSLLRDAGFLEARVERTDPGPFAPTIIFGLTWQGHEFLDAARDDTLWRRAKDKFIKPAGSWTAGILIEWLKVEIRSHIPGLQ